MSKLIVLFVFAALVCAAVAFNHRDPEFRDYVRKFEKNYHPTEVHRRYQAFVASKKRVEARNAEATARGFSTRYGLTKYSDLYPEEFNRLYKGYKKGSKDSSTIRAPQPIDYSLNVPDSYDWSQQGATTPIKDQGQCGSCWAFSATEGLESAWYLAKKKLPVLAPQQLVDCSWLDMGCDGGEIENAFRYIESYGLDTEASYPYVSGESGEWSGSCQYSTSNVGARMSTWYYATSNNNETQMLYVSYAKGPLSVCVDAETWQDYTGGVVENNCSDSLDHCVQLVGWGSDANNTPYWIVRNSWGTDWGLDGYIWIERNSDLCGISDDAAYVVV